MSYLSSLSDSAKNNLNLILKKLNENGFTNKFDLAAILSVISKESNFKPQTELGYKNTSNKRIRDIFGIRVEAYNDSQLTNLKKDDVKFFNVVYGPQWTSLGLGNKEPNDGFKYRGRGFLQLTGRGNYTKYAKLTGHDLVNNPELANNVNVAADIVAAYYKNSFASPNNKLKYYSSTGINKFKSLNDAIGAYFHSTSGWGRSLDLIKKDATGGLKKAKTRGPELLLYVESQKGNKANLLTLPMLIISYGIYRLLK